MAEASCSGAVRTARAVVEETGSSASRALHGLAGRSEKHAEEAFHKVVSEQRLALDIPLREFTIDSDHSMPVLLLSDWLSLYLSHAGIGNTFQLC